MGNSAEQTDDKAEHDCEQVADELEDERHKGSQDRAKMIVSIWYFWRRERTYSRIWMTTRTLD